LSQHQRRQDRLQDEGGTAGGAGLERVMSGLDASRAKAKLLRTERGPVDALQPGLRRGQHRHQVLPLQAGAPAAGANVGDVDLFARQLRQGQRGPNDLPSTLAGGTVEMHHAALLSQVNTPAERTKAAKWDSICDTILGL